MMLFNPVMVEQKAKLDTVPKIAGQYIIVIDAQEIYVDKSETERVLVTGSHIHIGTEAPENPSEGDIWIVVENESSEE